MSITYLLFGLARCAPDETTASWFAFDFLGNGDDTRTLGCENLLWTAWTSASGPPGTTWPRAVETNGKLQVIVKAYWLTVLGDTRKREDVTHITASVR